MIIILADPQLPGRTVRQWRVPFAIDGARGNLWVKYAVSRSDEDRNGIMEQYLGLVFNIARKMSAHLPKCVEIDDLASAGMFGLADAVKSFDPARKVRFTSFASRRINGAMLDYLRAIDWAPRRERTREKSGIVSIPRVASLEKKMFGDNNGLTKTDTIPDNQVDRFAAASQRRELLERICCGMTRMEKLIIALHFFENLTMKIVGQAVGVSESRISQTLKNLLLRMRARFKPNEFAQLLSTC